MTLLTVREVARGRGKPARREMEETLCEFEDTGRVPPPGGWQFYLGHGGIEEYLLFLLCVRLKGMGFSFVLEPRRFHARAGDAPSLRSSLDEMRDIFERCRAYLFVATQPKETSDFLAWQCGYFEGKSRSLGILPFLKKDTSRLDLRGASFLGGYPYAAAAKSVDTGGETLWMLRNPKDYVNLEYWIVRGFG